MFAAAWIHQFGGYDNPTNSVLVQTVLDGAKRSLGVPTKRKEPITASILRKIRRSLTNKKGKMDLKNTRLITFMTLAFAGFLRCDEARNVRRCDVAFHSSYLALLRKTDKPVSYNTIREEIKHAIARIGLDPSSYSTHSLRAGGVSAAANNGIPDRLFKIHGRWQSDDSKDRYVKESIHRRLKVTLNLGL